MTVLIICISVIFCSFHSTFTSDIPIGFSVYVTNINFTIYSYYRLYCGFGN